MAPLNRQKAAPLSAGYDRVADVLYVTLGSAIPDVGEDAPRGIILRYSMANDQPTGATVVGLFHNHWDREIDGLAKRLGDHLKASPSDIGEAIRSAVKEDK
jgi:hypothetical protein